MASVMALLGENFFEPADRGTTFQAQLFLLLAVAARADGWTHANWGAADTSSFRGAAQRLDAELKKIGRDRAEIETSASIACVPGGWRRVDRGFSEREVETGGVERLAEVVKAYAGAGAQHVILSLSPDPFAELDAGLLEKTAPILKLLG